MSSGPEQGGSGVAGAVRWLAMALALAVLVNGSDAYLKRIGVLERDTYHRYIEAYCPANGASGATGPCACLSREPGQLDPAVRFAGALPLEPGYVYLNPGPWAALKLAKDLLFLAAGVVGCVWLWRQRRQSVARHASPPWPVWALGGLVLAGLAQGVLREGGLAPWLGLRAFGLFPLAWAVRPIAPQLGRFAPALVVLLAVQATLLAIEFASGLPLRLCPQSFRVAGTMVLPNSLGAMAVVALAFVASYGPRGRWQVLAWALALAVVACSGSGIGWVGLLVLAGLQASARAHLRVAVFAALAIGGALLAVTLPTITQRPDIYDSVFAPGGRLDTLEGVVRAAAPFERAFGQGLGVGANAAISYAPAAHPDPSAVPVYADSTLTALFMQLGAAGVLAFYALLAWAAWRDPAALPAFAIVLLVSLTMNVLELFPVNFLLAWMLARAWQRPVAAEGMRA